MHAPRDSLLCKLRNGWTVDEALDLHSSREVSAENWAELGRLFVEYFDDDKLQRE